VFQLSVIQHRVNVANVKTPSARSGVSVDLAGIAEEEMSMRKMLLIGTAGTFIALGAINNAAQAANPNVPSYSPYALMDVGPMAAPAPVMGEQRAAYLAPGNGVEAGGVANTNVPSYSPYAIMPQGR
jgi:hypothetical protein